LSHTPRRPRHPGRHGRPSARAPQLASRNPDPAAGLRALVEEGIVAAAALNARDDLELAAASTQRLGTLSSGMWQALSRELATAAERLDRSTMNRMEDIARRARLLQVDPEQIVAVGVAAAHLAEHRETLETLVKPGEDAHRLLGPNMLFGYSVGASLVEEDEEEDDDDEPSRPAVEVALFLWPAPLTPAMVSIVPSLLPGGVAAAAVALGLRLGASAPLLDALTTATALARNDLAHALTELAVACWTAHSLDEEPLDDDDDEEEDIDDDVEDDDGPAGVDGL
jgi:hypothetical protein